jgi:hypothetical protein
MPKDNARYRMTSLVLDSPAGSTQSMAAWVIREIIELPGNKTEENFYGMRELCKNLGASDWKKLKEMHVVTGTRESTTGDLKVGQVDVKLLDTQRHWDAYVEACEADSKVPPFDQV